MLSRWAEAVQSGLPGQPNRTPNPSPSRTPTATRLPLYTYPSALPLQLPLPLPLTPTQVYRGSLHGFTVMGLQAEQKVGPTRNSNPTPTLPLPLPLTSM